jgi:predicted nucleic acid-binding protein
MADALYLDTSIVLRSVLESGTAPEIAARIRDARMLGTSRLSLVEACRALIRLRLAGDLPPARLADAEREVAAIWARCNLWELTPAVCEAACHLSLARALRTLDALHLATFVLARRRIRGLELLTVDERLREAAGTIA